MRIKEIEARLAAIKQDIEARGESMTAEEINALEQETAQLTEERAGLLRPQRSATAFLTISRRARALFPVPSSRTTATTTPRPMIPSVRPNIVPRG